MSNSTFLHLDFLVSKGGLEHWNREPDRLQAKMWQFHCGLLDWTIPVITEYVEIKTNEIFVRYGIPTYSVAVCCDELDQLLFGIGN